LISVLLYLLEKADNAELVSSIIRDIAVLSQVALKDKVNAWLLSLLQRRTEGKAELSIGHRKRVLKTNHANIYFLGDIFEKT
jgi:hypothetical protein